MQLEDKALKSGKSSIRERIIEAANLLQQDNIRMKKQEKHQMEGILYAFACKFLNQEELEEDISTVAEICEGAKLYAPEYDSGKIYEFLKGTHA